MLLTARLDDQRALQAGGDLTEVSGLRVHGFRVFGIFPGFFGAVLRRSWLAVKAMADKAGDLLDLFRDVLLTAPLDDRERFKQVGDSGVYGVPGFNRVSWAFQSRLALIMISGQGGRPARRVPGRAADRAPGRTASASRRWGIQGSTGFQGLIGFLEAGWH